MADQPVDKRALEKRDIASRARRLAHSLLAEDDKARLVRFADELDKEAAALEQSSVTFVQPNAASHQLTQHQQVQQQQQQATEPVQPAPPKKTE